VLQGQVAVFVLFRPVIWRAPGDPQALCRAPFPVFIPASAYLSAADRLSRSVAQPQRSDRRAWATMLWGDQVRKSSRKCRFAIVHAAT
jgi:hypothetical protein